MLAQCATLLRREAGFASGDAEKAHFAVTAALNKHHVSWGRGTVDTALHSKSIGNLKVLFLRYGPPVAIERQAGDFYVVQAPIRGRALLRRQGATFTVDRRVGAVLSPSTCGVVEWSGNCEQILVKVPARVVESVWRTVTDAPLRRLPEFDPALVLDGAAGAWFLHIVDCALRDPQLAGRGAVGSAFARRLEELFVLKLLMAQPHTLSDEILRHGGGLAPKSVRLAEEYMRAHLRDCVSLADLAAHARVSARSLHKAFHDFRRSSPMATYRAMRLDAARADIIASPPSEKVGDVALRWGFGHLGRFAEDYRRRFGESPSTTRRR